MMIAHSILILGYFNRMRQSEDSPYVDQDVQQLNKANVNSNIRLVYISNICCVDDQLSYMTLKAATNKYTLF
jgi:hypothetical protein